MMAIMSNLAPILSGVLTNAVSKAVGARVSDKEKAFEISLQIMSSLMTGAGGLVALLHWLVHRIRDRELELQHASTRATELHDIAGKVY